MLNKNQWAVVFYSFLLGLLVTPLAYGQGLQSSYHFRPVERKPKCPACLSLTNRYNAIGHELINQEGYLDAIGHDIANADKEFKDLDMKLANLKIKFIREPNAENKSTMEAMDHRLKFLNRKLANLGQQLSAEERNYSKLLREFNQAANNLDQCEKRFYSISFAHPICRRTWLSTIWPTKC